MSNTSTEFFDRINYALLREQKDTLLTVIDFLGDDDGNVNLDHLDGILHLIDAIQDHAVDDLGIAESTVFAKDGDA